MPNPPRDKRIPHILDEKAITELVTIVRTCDARTHALFTKVHNLQTEVAELTKHIATLTGTLLEILSEPSTHSDAIESMKKFVFDVTKKKGVIN